MRSFFALVILSFWLQTAFTQVKPEPLFGVIDAPDYIQLIHKEIPNVFEVEKSYREYFKTHPFKKDRFSQYYKRWMSWARGHMDNEGFAKEKSVIELEREEKITRQLRMPLENRLRNAPDWKFMGPAKTFHTDGQTKVTWQTNIYCLDISKSDPNILYAGGESGGIWKTIDKGLNWALTTRDVLHGSFNAIVIHPDNPDTVFASTSGKIIKSTDGGLSWSTVYTENGLNCYDFEIHSQKPQIIFAAGNKGLLFSEDGGKTWNKKWTELCWTLKVNVDNPDIFYCIRQMGSSTEFMTSTNGGLNWNSNTINWYVPAAGTQVTGAIIAICPDNSQKLYAYLCGQGGTLNGYVGVFVSADGGTSWNNTNPNNAIGGTYSIPAHTNLMAHNGTDGFDQGFYDMAIIVNPQNENELIAGGTSWFKSIDGGKTWTALGSYVGGLSWSHPDIQCLEAVGNDLWIGSDGGLNYSSNFGISMEARMDGISGADLWGFDSGWNDDILVGGRYHNGNMAWNENFPSQTFYRMGGAESPTGYVNPGPGRKTYFSDIGGYSLNGNLMQGVRYFPVGLFPNESYAYYANSQMLWHPNCWNIIFLGNENKIWKSEDGGSTFQLLHTFPGNADHKVYEIEISRSHPLVMYCSQWDGTDDAMWKSEDGGFSWKKLTALPLPNNNDRVKMSLSAGDPKILWVAVTYGSNGRKIYKTTDGGASWINLTTAILNDVRISDVLHASGTDGGIYLGTNRGVFYRNNAMQDWQPFSTGLPLSAETNRLKPFYRDGKLRNGCWGFGVWETELFENSSVLPKIMADKLQSNCLRDTFYFDDHSVLHHAGVSWNWTVEDAAHAIGLDTRTPKIVFNSKGYKNVIMHIKSPTGIYTDSLTVFAGDACEMDSLPGNALFLDGSQGYAQVPSLDKSTNRLTMMAWVKSAGDQNNWAGILFCRSNSQAAGLSVLNNGDLRYHWNSGGYNWNSQARLMPNEWTHLALVAEPTGITIYKNGVAYRHNVSINEHSFVSPISIGADLNGGDRLFKGLIDEVCIYDRALTQNEIREIMHLTRTHSGDSGLIHYFQFNEDQGRILDRKGVSHASLNATAIRELSTVPVGPGYSHRLDIRGAGIYQFGNTNLNVETTDIGIFPNGELCVTRINFIPEMYFKPNNYPGSPSYWILHNYGSNSTFTPFKNIEFDKIGWVSANSPAADYLLFKRVPNADTSLWEFVNNASGINPSPNGSVNFENANVQTEAQFLVTKSWNDTLVVNNKQIQQDSRDPYVWIYPNPVPGHDQCFIKTNLTEELKLKLVDSHGRLIKSLSFLQQTELDLSELVPGNYFVIFETSRQMFLKQLFKTKE